MYAHLICVVHRYFEICLRSIKVCVRIEMTVTKTNRITHVPFYAILYCCHFISWRRSILLTTTNVALKRRKRLIILVKLDDPITDLRHDDDASDKSALRHYVRQYTYVDYTKDDWIDRLLYALPL